MAGKSQLLTFAKRLLSELQKICVCKPRPSTAQALRPLLGRQGYLNRQVLQVTHKAPAGGTLPVIAELSVPDTGDI
jgi:hypothetical protein